MTAGYGNAVAGESRLDPEAELTPELVDWTKRNIGGGIGYDDWIDQLKRYDKSVRKCVRVWGSGNGLKAGKP